MIKYQKCVGAFCIIILCFALLGIPLHVSHAESTSNKVTKNEEALGEEKADLTTDSITPDSPKVHFEDEQLAKLIAETLGIEGREITEADLANLTKLTNPDDQYTFTSLEGLQYAKNLEILDLSTLYKNEIFDISVLSKLKKLESLSLGRSSISDITILSGLKNLTYLDLESNQISDISALENLENLTYINLAYNQITDISALSNLTNLNTLDLTSNFVSNISSLSNLINLENLSLNANKITGISPLSKLVNLKSLGFSFNQVTDISALADLHNLEELQMNENQITDISSLTNLKKLVTLFAYSNSISDINSLSGLTNLVNLELSFNKITNISVLRELALSSLANVYLSGNRITDEATIQYLEDNIDYVISDVVANREELINVFPKEQGFRINEDGSVTLGSELTNDTAQITLSTKQLDLLLKSGQTLTLINDKVQVDIPSAVFDHANEPVTISVKEQDKAKNSLSSSYNFTIKQGNRTISEFEQGITLTFDTDSNRVKNKDNLKVFYFNEETSKWENVGGTYQNGKVTVVTNHFSTFTVFEVAGDDPTSDDIVIIDGNEEPKLNDNTSNTGNENGSLGNTSTNDSNKENEDSPSTNNENKNSSHHSTGDTENSNKTQKVVTNGEKLPDTATNTYTLLLAGTLLLLIGGIVIFTMHVRKRLLKS